MKRSTDRSSWLPCALCPRRCAAFAPLLLLAFLAGDRTISARASIAGRHARARSVGVGPRRRSELRRYRRHRGGLSGRHPDRCAGTPCSFRRAATRWPRRKGRGWWRSPMSRPIATSRRCMSDAQARHFAATLAALRDTLAGRIPADRLRGAVVAARVFRAGGRGAAPRLPDAALGRRAVILVPQRELDPALAVDEMVPMFFRMGPDRPADPGVCRRRGDFRSPNAAPASASRPTSCRRDTGRPAHLRLQPDALDRRKLSELRTRIHQWSDASASY